MRYRILDVIYIKYMAKSGVGSKSRQDAAECKLCAWILESSAWGKNVYLLFIYSDSLFKRQIILF